MTKIHYIARNDLDQTITIAINGVRWEYWLSHTNLDTAEHLFHKVSAGKALAFTKRRATKEVRL
jgi:hypothetical protein